VQILLSGDLDEYRIASALGAGAEADAFGVGTALGTSDDAPTMGGVYKIVEDTEGPKIKLSTGKATLPGRKQVWRHRTASGPQDVIALADEPAPLGSEPLLARVMADGRVIRPDTMDAMRARCREALAALPPAFTDLQGSPDPPVRLTPRLDELRRAMFQKNETRRRP
jgi:nicotinate phosphoribosyltransferase